MAPTELDTLLRALAERGVPLNEDDVAWAFEDASTRDKAAGWVRQNLNPTTLLSQDELKFVEKRGLDAANAGKPAGRPLSEAEFEAAIDSLEASTAAIQKQCELLESQKKALKEIQARNASQNSVFNARESREKKFARQKAQLDFDTDELSQGANGRLRTLSKQSDAANSGIPSSVERLLEKDDRLLDGLQKVLPKFSSNAENGDEYADVERLCSALATLSAKEIRARLDKVYCEALSDYSTHQNGTANGLSDSKMKQRDTLRAELNELGSEIDGLVAIAVDHQYRKPLKRGMLSAQVDSQAQKARWSEYTVAALAYLTSRLDAIGDHMNHLHSHSSALRTVSRTLEETVAAPSPISGMSQKPNSPVVDRTGGKGLKPLRLVQANLAEGQDPAIPFLRQHDIRVADADTSTKVTETLDATLRSREHKLSKLSNATEGNIADALSISLASTESNLRDLLGGVYVHSERDSIELVDSAVQTRMDELEYQTQNLGGEMRTLDLDDVAHVIKGKQRQLVEALADG